MKKQQPKLSVIISVYNTEKYLRRCLNSVVNQTLKDIEIICINDGSTDDSLIILEEYAKSDSRIKIFSQKNKGRSSARNFGLSKASALYVSFVDSDDEIELNTYEMVLSHISGKNIDCVCWGIQVIGNADEQQQKQDDEYYAIKYNGKVKTNTDVILACDASLCNKIFKVNLIKKYNIQCPDGLIYEDACFFYQYSVITENMYFLKKQYYHYYRNENSIMVKTFNKFVRSIDHLYIIEPIYNFYKKNKIFERYKDLFIKLFNAYYWAAHRYVPENMQNRVDKQALAYIKKWDLKKLYPEDPLINILTNKKKKFIETLFSLKNSRDKTHKIITIFGIHFKFKKKNN